uniref:Uncharacterized protein n=1 Tax=Timema douglasi TaxID=61478 RepID=A0A7R8W1A1_TIMDO|nr:unnamed protein product [Timema douglasi]
MSRIEPRPPAQKSDTLPLDRQVTDNRFLRRCIVLPDTCPQPPLVKWGNGEDWKMYSSASRRGEGSSAHTRGKIGRFKEIALAFAWSERSKLFKKRTTLVAVIRALDHRCRRPTRRLTGTSFGVFLNRSFEN